MILSVSHSRTFLGRFLWCIWLGGMRSILDLLGSNLGVDLLWYSWGFPHALLGCYGALKTHSMSTLGRLRNIPSTLVLFFLYFYVREKNSCLGFIDRIKHFCTPFSFILSFFSLNFSRVLSGILSRCQETYS